MEISLTSFSSIKDNQTHKRLDFSNWDHFEKFLYILSERPLGGKKDAELISPAIYTTGETRSNRNVLGWAGWAAVDVDDIQIRGNLKDYFYSRIGHWHYVVYSTASCTVEKPKLRIVFKLDQYIQSDKIRHFWFALQTALDDNGDKQCKDLSRMYYVPGKYKNANNFIFTNVGEPLIVNELLAKYPYAEPKKKSFIERLPETLQKKVMEHRKSKMEGKYSWSHYTDCPFVNKNLINEYKAIAYQDNSGRYAMIYKIMVSIAVNAVKKDYPIQTYEIVELIRQLDTDTSNRYENRALDTEADRAIEYAYRGS